MERWWSSVARVSTERNDEKAGLVSVCLYATSG